MNTKLLKDVVKIINDQPKKHDQGSYARKTHCGTACCVAGWVCKLSGYKFSWRNIYGERITETTQLTTGEHIPEKAQELLGLTTSEAKNLFDCDNSLEDINEQAKELLRRKS
jgi:hypothetical protein